MKKQSWRKVLSIVLCVAMILVSSSEIFAVGIDAAISAAGLGNKISSFLMLSAKDLNDVISIFGI